jgi:hypothetical protein
MPPVWIGVAEVSVGQNCDLDLDAAGSFVWCATQAASDENFSKKIGEMLEFYGLHLIALRNVKQFEDLDSPSDELTEIAGRAAESPDFALYGTFHTYPHHRA